MTVKITRASQGNDNLLLPPCRNAVLTKPRHFATCPASDYYAVEINTIDDLLDLLREVKDIIIYTDPHGNPINICVYDAYVEDVCEDCKITYERGDESEHSR